ncbi:hypothetical protein QF001_001680 [Paraburkholderia youngii]|uniref:hypothetical protein n=1 Tax=Paraburkholderia youngii TaxID=2782701 RepID=UPI003D19A6C5
MDQDDDASNRPRPLLALWCNAHRRDPDDAAMNQYAHVKIKRITSAQQAIDAANARSNQFRASLGTLLGLASILTLLLLLTSIERKTRRLHATNEACIETKT